MIKLLERKIGDLTRKKIAILGLAFKNDTDDVRESRSIPVIKALKEKGAIIKAYDPMAIPNMKKELKNYKDIIYCNTAEDALQDADACLVMTEWNEFRYLDKEFLYMKNKVVIDGRKMIDPKKIKDIDYVGLCW
ncbi:MAG: UDP binding domain-containing protein [Methanosarcinales archaeon]